MEDNISFPYIAGFIDGEGCITSIICKKSNRDAAVLGICLVVTNTNLSVLERIKIKFECGVIVKKKDVRKTPCWSLRIDTHKTLKTVLRSILPYLRVKQKNAELALSFIESRLSRCNHSQYSEKEISIFFELRQSSQRPKEDTIQYRDTKFTKEEFIKFVLGRTPNYLRIDWTQEQLDLLGKNTDLQTAKILGIKRSTVRKRRVKEGIIAYGHRDRGEEVRSLPDS